MHLLKLDNLGTYMALASMTNHPFEHVIIENTSAVGSQGQSTRKADRADFIPNPGVCPLPPKTSPSEKIGVR